MHQGWLRSLIAGWVVHLGVRVRGMLRLFCMMKPREEEEPGICFSKTPGVGWR